MVLIDTKTEQLAAIVNTYQALGGGVLTISTPADFHGQFPYIHTVRSGENFWTISLLYYRSGRYGKALWAANKDAVPAFDRLTVGDKIIIPPVNQLDPALIEEVPAPAPPVPETVPGAEPATLPPLPRHHPQACLARSARRGPKTPPSKPPAAPNPPRPRRSRRRRGSDRCSSASPVALADRTARSPGLRRQSRERRQPSELARERASTQECPPGTVAMFRTTMHRLLTSVDSEAINYTTWMSCIVCPEFWGSLARRKRI